MSDVMHAETEELQRVVYRLQQMREKELSDVVERPKNRERLGYCI